MIGKNGFSGQDSIFASFTVQLTLAWNHGGDDDDDDDDNDDDDVWLTRIYNVGPSLDSIHYLTHSFP